MPSALAEMPLLTAGEQTKLTWARPVETLGEAPKPYANALAELVAELGYFPYCILTPSYTGFLTHTTEKLVCCYGEQVHILQRVGVELRVVNYTLAAIDWIEFGSILLKGWLKIAGVNRSGEYAITSLRFNSVTDRLFLPILKRWRSGGPQDRQAGEAAPLTDEQAKFNGLGKDHYKFMNVARRVLFPGDTVLAYVMQPEMRAPVTHLFGHNWSRIKAPAHIVILTGRELIVAAEERGHGWRDEPRYGSVSTYIPLAKIAGVYERRTQTGDLHVTLDLPGNEQLALEFGAEHAADVERLLALLPVHAGSGRATV
jgi:hypothetical protein